MSRAGLENLLQTLTSTRRRRRFALTAEWISALAALAIYTLLCWIAL